MFNFIENHIKRHKIKCFLFQLLIFSLSFSILFLLSHSQFNIETITTISFISYLASYGGLMLCLGYDFDKFLKNGGKK